MGQFSDEVLEKAFARANARCLCEREGHAHSTFAYFKQIEWKNQGRTWEARYIVGAQEGGKPTVENREIFCEDCYPKTPQTQR